MKTLSIAGIILSLFIFSCRDADEPGSTPLRIDIEHVVGSKALIFDTLAYTNAAGENYKITRLEYYLSKFRFYKNDAKVYELDTVVYVNGMKSNSIFFLNTRPISFDSVAFYIGVDPENNINGHLPPTAENVAMEWPQAMGGGYHFLKFEGHWKDGIDQPGFALHIGRDPFIINAGAKGNKSIEAGKTNVMTLTMNLNEWFANPKTFSLKNDGNYTMGDSTLMSEVSINGRDVFTMK